MAVVDSIPVSKKIDTLDSTPKGKVSTDLQHKLLDYRTDLINWWLASIAIFLTFFGVVVVLGSYLGFKTFREIEVEARGHVKEVREYEEQARQSVGEISEQIEEAEQEVREYEEQARQSVGEIREQIEES